MTVIDSNKYPAVRISKFKKFLRNFILWQIIRFIWINIYMTFMIIKSHGSENPEFKKKTGA